MSVFPSPEELDLCADLWAVLGRAFSVPRDAHFVRAFIDDLPSDLREIAQALGLQAQEVLNQFETAARTLADPLELQRLYAALFLVPPAPVALNTAVYLDGTVLGPSELAMNAAYARCGFRRDPQFRDLADHPAAQFEFLARLFARAAAARRRGEEEGVRVDLEEAERFLATFPRRWITPFCSALERACAERGLNPCYLWLARFLWLAIERACAKQADRWSATNEAAMNAQGNGGSQPTAEDLVEIALKLDEAGLSFEHVRALPQWREELFQARQVQRRAKG